MVHMPIRAVLFDLFDTLLLLEDAEVYYPFCLNKVHEFLLNHAVNVPFETFKETYFTVRDEMVTRTRATLEEPHFNLRIFLTLQRLGFKLRESDPTATGATKVFADEFKRHTSLDPEALDVLKQLHRKYRLGVVSNFGIPECGWELLDEYGLRQFLDAVVISGEINRRKPSPEIFKMGLEALDVKASETIFVGDSLDLDVQGPQDVGMKTILIKRRPLPEGTLVKPDAIIEKLSELLICVRFPGGLKRFPRAETKANSIRI
jgi:putative hydrolase of the HAD superfamily